MSWGSPVPGVARDHLALLGWHSKRASLGYDQSVGQVVVNVQQVVAKSAAVLGERYSEADLHAKLAHFIADRFNIDQDSVMSELAPIMFESVACILVDSVVPARSSSSSSSSEVPLIFPEVAVSLEAIAADEEPLDKKAEGQHSPYWVSISERTAFRRLHRRGGCWFKAVRMEPVWDLSGLPYHAQCGHCWRTGQAVKNKAGTAQENEEDPSVDTDDETSSSSSEGEPSTPK